MGTRNPEPAPSCEHGVNHRAGLKSGPPLASFYYEIDKEKENNAFKS